jgi:hypothetical protein
MNEQTFAKFLDRENGNSPEFNIEESQNIKVFSQGSFSSERVDFTEEFIR